MPKVENPDFIHLVKLGRQIHAAPTTIIRAIGDAEIETNKFGIHRSQIELVSQLVIDYKNSLRKK